jgi:ABC-type transport system involved in multi-copper enzyme maturation permease subunit
MRNLIIHDWPLVDWGFAVLLILYLLAYTAAFLVAACLVFRRKPVN